MTRYGGPYLHQQAMLDAYKRLYMLGNHAHHPGKVDLGDDLAEGASNIGGAIKADKDARNARAQAALQKQASDKYIGNDSNAAGTVMGSGSSHYAALALGGPEAYNQSKERERVGFGIGMPENPRNPYEEALAASEKNEMAQHARIGGTYTLQGLQQTQKDADDLGHDQAYGKILYGLGGTMPTQQVTNPPPDYMQGYRIPQ